MIICETNSLFFVSIGLYNADKTTAPNPPSNNDMKLRNCLIEETNPLISEPNAFIISRGNISPDTIVMICKASAEIKFNLFLI